MRLDRQSTTVPNTSKTSAEGRSVSMDGSYCVRDMGVCSVSLPAVDTRSTSLRGAGGHCQKADGRLSSNLHGWVIDPIVVDPARIALSGGGIKKQPKQEHNFGSPPGALAAAAGGAQTDQRKEESSMNDRLLGRRAGRWGRITLAFVSCLALTGTLSAWADDDHEGDDDNGKPRFAVPRATCGSEDHPETDLQGQVSAALRASGFKGFNCNLKLLGQSRGDGGNWQSTEFKDRHGHVCAYHTTAYTTANRSHTGVPVIDLTNPEKPTPTTYLTTTSMLDPWESLKVNERRRLLGADNGHNGGFAPLPGNKGPANLDGGGPEVDIYDVSGDCRYPQLLASASVSQGLDANGFPEVVGHEGSWAPDGLTYYGGDLFHGLYYAVDTANPREPKMITKWTPGFANVHGLSISDDG